MLSCPEQLDLADCTPAGGQSGSENPKESCAHNSQEPVQPFQTHKHHTSVNAGPEQPCYVAKVCTRSQPTAGTLL